MKARSIGVALLAATAMLTTACSDDDGGGGGGGFSVAASLEEIPIEAITDDGITQVFVADLDAATDLAGLERPGSADPDEVLPWLNTLTGGPSDDGFAPIFVPIAEGVNPQLAADVAKFEEALGWSVADVETFVEAPNPPERFSVFTGSFDRDDIESAASVETLDGGDFLSAGEGEDLATDLTGDVAWDRLGRPLRMALEGDRLAASLTTPLLEAWADGGDSLADDEGFSRVAGALDDAGAVSAVLLKGSFAGFGTNIPPEAAERLSENAISSAFDTVGIGWGVEDGRPVITVAYHFGSGDRADSAADEIRTLFEEGVSVRSARPLSDHLEVTSLETSGPVAVVSLTPADGASPAVVWQMANDRDMPFVHL